MKNSIKLIASLFIVIVLFAMSVPVFAYENVIEEDGVMQIGDFDNLTDGHVVYYPVDLSSSNKKYPVAIWANGTMCAPALYYDLLIGIAKKGYIVIASPELMAKDGTAQIASIDYIIAKNENPDSVFYGKVDTDKIGAFGHSQGGLSSVNAALNDNRIGAVVSIAGNSKKKQAQNLNTPTLFLTGTLDTIVLSSIYVNPSYNVCPAPAVFASLKDGLHASCIKNPDTYINYTTKWFNAWLFENGDKTPFLPGGELSKDAKWTDYKSKNFDNNLYATVFADGISIYLAIGFIIVAALICVIVIIRKKRKDASIVTSTEEK